MGIGEEAVGEGGVGEGGEGRGRGGGRVGRIYQSVSPSPVR